jgi:hypothetical protein
MMRTPSQFRRWHKVILAIFGPLSFAVLVVAFAHLSHATPASAQQGGMTVPLDLARMVDESENVVLARVTDVKAEKHPQLQNLDTVVVTLDIIEPLKGGPGRQYSFRQYVFDIRDRDSKLGYRVGDEVVLLLRRPSAQNLTSPVGFEQGRFRVERDAQGNRFLRNGIDNAALFDGVDKTAPTLKNHISPAVQQMVVQHRSGPISYEDFRSFVQGVLAARQAAQ